VIKYWPEFGKHGKDNVTVKILVGHEAGLAALDEPITWEIQQDWRKMSTLFENQVPYWPPGYHALTFGWLCEQLVRRVDPQHRSLGQFLQEEIAKPFNIDFFIGIPREELYRMARLAPPSIWDVIIRLDDWPFVEMLLTHLFKKKPLLHKVMGNPEWFTGKQGGFIGNNPDFQEVEIPAVNGVGTARALARLFCLLDGSELLSKNTVDKITKPVTFDQEDNVIGMNLTTGWGFLFTKNPDGHYRTGHPGYGGQNAKFDPHEHLAYAYLRSNVAPDMFEYTRTFRNLQNALYQSTKALKAKVDIQGVQR